MKPVVSVELPWFSPAPVSQPRSGWQKPKRKRCNTHSKSWRRMRLYWKSLDRASQWSQPTWKKRPTTYRKRISVRVLRPFLT